MILENLKTWDRVKHHYGESLQKAVAFLKENDFTKMEPGKYEIDGDRIYASLVDKETSPKEKRAPESHERYIDIQFLVSGREIIGYAKKSNDLVIKEDMLAEKDLIKYTNDVPNEIDLKIITRGFCCIFS